MNIVVGYLPTPAGRAALRAAIDEAKLRAADLVVVQGHHTKRWGRHTGPEETEAALIEDDLALVREIEGLDLTRFRPDRNAAAGGALPKTAGTTR